ncbi:uncharacterized protein LOC134264733 [Saccostrea cucullata]|uniref:uncharacterized protein LOC134264733 n=1 Tax=Saccostrea cuccullata TaxID=36930 RepID=UPI002ED686B9
MIFKKKPFAIFYLVILLVNNSRFLLVEGDDSQCWSLNGRCQYSGTSEKCFLFKPGLCAGPANRQCCVLGADVQCWRTGGICKDNSNYCSGRYLRGLCGGGLSRQCCV